MLAAYAGNTHNELVAQTTVTWFDSQNATRRTTATKAVFLRPYAVARPFWAGDCGEGSRPAGSLERRSVNPAFCPPTPFDSGTRVHPALGGRHG